MPEKAALISYEIKENFNGISISVCMILIYLVIKINLIRLFNRK